MSKILVEVSVPAADRRRDVFIPFECRMHEITELVKAVFADEVAESYEPVADTLLCDAETGYVFDVNSTPEELGLENGSRLLLI